MTMSVYGALDAWQSGKITEAKALQLTGMQTRQDLYVICLNGDVEIRDTLSDEERKAVEAARVAMNAPVD